MIELKTLKDIEEEIKKRFDTEDMHQPGRALHDKTQRDFFRSGYKVSFKYALRDVKKELGIKYIKYLQDIQDKMVAIAGEKYRLVTVDAYIEILTNIFNITKEDLK